MATNPFDQQKPIPGVKHIITVGSGKGGVGKSTVALNLAIALSKNHQVGLLDADIYGPSLPRMTGTSSEKLKMGENNKIIPLEKYGIKLMSMGYMVAENMAVIWRGPMLFKAIDQFFNDIKWGELDFLIIDLPPGTGDVQLSISQKVPVSGAVIVSTPQNVALLDAKKAIDMFVRTGIKIIGLIENMSYMLSPTNEKLEMFPKGEMDSYLDQLKITKLGEIPFHAPIAVACEEGTPVIEKLPDSIESKEMQKIALQIAQLI